MEYLKYFFSNIIFDSVSLFTIIYLTSILLDRKPFNIKHHIVWGSFFLISTISIYTWSVLHDFNIYPVYISIIFYLIYLALFYKNTFDQKLFALCVLNVFLYLIEILIKFIHNSFITSHINAVPYNVIIIIVRLIVIVIYHLFVSKTYGKQHFRVNAFRKKQSFFFSIMLFIYFFYIILFDSFLDSSNLNWMNIEAFKIITILILTLFSVGTIIFIGNYNKEKMLKQLNLTSQKQLELQLTHYNNLESALEDTRRIKHDMKNHILCIKYLNESKNYNELTNYLNEIETSINSINTGIYTGNNVIDAIINQKMFDAKKHDISFSVIGSLPSKPFINNLDICAIVSNSIDNAIEACQKVSDNSKKHIDIETNIERNHWLYKITNTSNEVIISPKTELIKTNKSDSLNHGLGLKNIYSSIEKYNGTHKILYENGKVKLSSIIPL